MRTTITLDDLTGRQSTETAEVVVVFGDYDSFSLDLTQESRDALLALFRDHDSDPVRKLLMPVIEPEPVKPATGSKRKRNRDTGAAEKRAWAKAHGYEVKERGKLSKEATEAYAAAHSTAQ